MTDLTTLSNEELVKMYHSANAESDLKGTSQHAKKVLLNSLYGALANNYFRHYRTKDAEAITLSGQHMIRFLGKRLAEFIQSVAVTDKTVDEQIIYGDTDSIYLSVQNIVDKFKDKIPEDKWVDFLDKFVNDKIQPEIKSALSDMSEYMNFYQNALGAKREAIASSGIWCVHPSTRIETTSGRISISDLYEAGDVTSTINVVKNEVDLYVMDESTGNIVVDTSNLIIRKPYSGKMYCFRQSWRTVDVTENHLMCVCRGEGFEWVEAKNVNPDDSLVLGDRTHDDQNAPLNIFTYDYKGYVYDINMNNHHNFMTNGIVVHNCGKKRYALHVWDLEGVRYDHPHTKVIGIETQKSSTPKVVRDALLKALNILLGGTEAELRVFVDQFEREFNDFPIEQIAFPRSVNGVEKYLDASGKTTPGCPIHSRASIAHNRTIKELGITGVQPISGGDKILFCYLKPNPFHSNVIAFVNKPPKEFKLDLYIDRKTQFEKTFMSPLINIMEAVKWGLVDVSSLDEFF